jgi:hypothetical protein
MAEPITFEGFVPQFTFTMPQSQAERIHKLVTREIGARKNWKASAVERGDYEKAHQHGDEIRCLESLSSAFNVEAKHLIARCRGLPLETAVTVEERRR